MREQPSSTNGLPVETGPLGELAVTRGAEEVTDICSEGVLPSASAESGRTSGVSKARTLWHPPWLPLFPRCPHLKVLLAQRSKWPMLRSRPGEEEQGKQSGRIRLWQRCSELLGERRRLRYLTTKPTCRRRPNHQRGNPNGCVKNLRLWRNRRNMNAGSLAPVLGSGTRTYGCGSRFPPTHGSP